MFRLSVTLKVKSRVVDEVLWFCSGVMRVTVGDWVSIVNECMVEFSFPAVSLA